MKSSKNVNINENKENKENKNNTLEDLIKIINENKCEFGDKTFTHTLFGDKKILFKIEDENYKEFLTAYKTALNGNYGSLRILEKPRENGPLCLDFDLRQVESERKIKVDHIMMVVEILNKIILKYYKIQDKDYELQSFITMKNELCYVEQEKL